MPRTARDPRLTAVCALAVLLGSLCAGALSGAAHASTVTLPPAGRFDYQLGGAYRPPTGVTTVVRDRTEKPAKGRYDVCYLNGFQTQPNATGWWRRHHPHLLLEAGGREVGDAAWGEVLLDTSTAAKRARIAAIEGRWIDRCAADGFDAVDPDNLDSWGRSRKRLTPADNFALAALLIARAHRDGLAIAQKNAAELSARGRRIGFDFAVAEECAAWRECRDYTAAYGDHVLEIEYTDNGRKTFARACAAAGHRRPVILRDRYLVPAHAKGYVYRSCWSRKANISTSR